MFKKIFCLTALSMMSISGFLTAEVEYDIRDIGTLQTKASQAIALNNQGQILGWYNIDGSATGKQFFVRNRDGVFYELPGKEPASGLAINWQYLTDNGTAYGTFDVNPATRALCIWNQQYGIVKLGVLSGKEISAVNNAGQVLIKSITVNENGKSIQRPAIWQNGQITMLKGLGGDLGIESEESYGLDMNNNGDVVGQSLVALSYKNEIYKQMHAVKWVNGQAIDLHKKVPKSSYSLARAINDIGEVFLAYGFLIKEDGSLSTYHNSIVIVRSTDNNYIYDADKHGHSGVWDKNMKKLIDNSAIANKMLYDPNSIWMSITGIVCVNDNGEIIANGTTIYGEGHALFLCPAFTN